MPNIFISDNGIENTQEWSEVNIKIKKQPLIAPTIYDMETISDMTNYDNIRYENNFMEISIA